MNRGLLIVSMILVVAGIASGFVPLILIGVFLLLPALASRRRVRTEPRGEPPRSILTTESSRESHQPSAPVLEAPPPPPPQPTTNSGMLPPLFPVQIFPTLSPVHHEVPVSDQVPKKEVLSELLEMGGILLLARFLFRRRRQPT
ncbi:MAG: hypothetical protein HYZ12_00505 [Thaumarchaeota archaeon]|nr:hypothetical protein [Nitrososphaerota archaeon]